jgi:enediyne biosynthesis protein E4
MNRLYRNNHDGTFTDVTDKAGARGFAYSIGRAAADFDNERANQISSTEKQNI